ncbi:hypothetical protein QBC46DRAFT_411765 [Diplogelasinospora grovesii]|uniref:Uncharacterized protein n=1 Tax=Diplogelasinospora grovesii TaxID=303347 RepID=A0AAN6N101_9PEZI|nr:hypothetical protein QBC46DRAFT_411765 [Diplogelasinospora grovesii]
MTGFVFYNTSSPDLSATRDTQSSLDLYRLVCILGDSLLPHAAVINTASLPADVRTTMAWRRNTGAVTCFLNSFISLRKMKTPLMVRGAVVYPGAALPEWEVRTVELNHEDPDLAKHLKRKTIDNMTFWGIIAIADMLFDAVRAFLPSWFRTAQAGSSKKAGLTRWTMNSNTILRKDQLARIARRGTKGTSALALLALQVAEPAGSHES